MIIKETNTAEREEVNQMTFLIKFLKFYIFNKINYSLNFKVTQRLLLAIFILFL